MPTSAFLLDIEGTTTPISFVHEVLFAYARQHFKTFLEYDDATDDLDRLSKEHAMDIEAPPLLEPYIYWLMDHDRKSPALKSLQGKIWERGYRDGSLLATVYDDVPRAFERWTKAGLSVNIFSSGSVLAQKLLFRHTNAGDLTAFINRYFDTAVGKKNESSSYEKIAADLGLPCGNIHFVSDVVAELDGAAEAGMTTSLCVRPGNQSQGSSTRHTVIESFDELTSI
jgi:enolase-phosphatase E1